MTDPHLQKRGLIQSIEHPVYGNIKQIGSPFPFLRGKEMRLHPPEHGEHTMEVLMNLGFEPKEIEGFRKARVI